MAGKEVDSVFTGLVEAYFAKNIDKICSYYTDDCFFLYPSVKGGKGKDIVRKTYTDILGKYDTFEFHNTDRTIHGDMAVEGGKYKLGKGGKIDEGCYLSVLVKEGGKWRFRYDVTSEVTK